MKQRKLEVLVTLMALLLAIINTASESPIYHRSVAFTSNDLDVDNKLTGPASELFSKKTLKNIALSKAMFPNYLSSTGVGDIKTQPVTIAKMIPPPDNAAKIPIKATGVIQIKNDDGERIAKANDASEVNISYYNDTYYLSIDGKLISTSSTGFRAVSENDEAIILPSYSDLNWNGTVNLNQFRSTIDVRYSKKSKKLWAINELSLENYLKGVSEAKADAPGEHLKVMAIVERSYAWHHIKNGGKHKDEPFILKNSRGGNGDDQIYQGYLAEKKLPTIVSAVKATTGSVVTYNGEPVITPYSSNPSGRTLTPKEAGWGNLNWPWVKSVSDPDTAGMIKNGHGVGLSGVGSLKRAERGEKAENILSYYFWGISIRQVQSQGTVMRVAIYGVEG